MYPVSKLSVHLQWVCKYIYPFTLFKYPYVKHLYIYILYDTLLTDWVLATVTWLK